jgi:hypothetical protein
MMRGHQNTLSLIEALKVNYHRNGSANSSNHDTKFHNVGYPKTRKTLILAMKPSEFGGLTDRTDGKAQNENPGQRPMHRLVAECLTISKVSGGLPTSNTDNNIKASPPAVEKIIEIHDIHFSRLRLFGASRPLWRKNRSIAWLSTKPGALIEQIATHQAVHLRQGHTYKKGLEMSSDIGNVYNGTFVGLVLRMTFGSPRRQQRDYATEKNETRKQWDPSPS